MKRLTLLLTCCCMLLGGRAFGEVIVSHTGSVATASSSTSVSATAPGGSGGVLVLFVATAAVTEPTTPTGWTQRASVRESSSNPRMLIYDRVSDGGADDSPTVSGASSNWAAAIVRLAGVDAGDYFDAAATSIDNDIDNSGDLPSFTVANDGSLQLAGYTGSSGWIVNSWPSPLASIISNSTSRALSVGESARDSGAVGVQSIGLNGSARKAMAVVVYKPAAAHSGNGVVYPLIIGKLTRPTPWTRFISFTPLMLEAR